MKQKFVVLIPLLALVLNFTGCGTVGNDIAGAYNMTQCKYTYNSVSDVSVSGINLSTGSGLSPINLVKLSTILTGGTPSSLPLNFTVNMNVTNPNQSTAMLNRLQYDVSIDNIHFTSGSLDQPVSIAAGATQTLPLAVGLDVANLMKSNSQSALLNIVRNIAGISGEKSTVSLSLRPTFNIGGQPITSPIAFPVTFSFGGKK